MSVEKLSETENTAIANFREYLRIPSTSVCRSCAAKRPLLGLPIQVYHVVEGKPIVVITWRGSEPALPAILLNSHMDVFPTSNNVEEMHQHSFKRNVTYTMGYAQCRLGLQLRWKREPFAAEMDDEGNIFARGTQDTKAVGVQYMEAVRWLRAAGLILRRTVHIAFTP
ncbi:unnamed protein product, partial [Timema podura]|nr:unnamed protein product [Timema podura]